MPTCSSNIVASPPHCLSFFWLLAFDLSGIKISAHVIILNQKQSSMKKISWLIAALPFAFMASCNNSGKESGEEIKTGSNTTTTSTNDSTNNTVDHSTADFMMRVAEGSMLEVEMGTGCLCFPTVSGFLQNEYSFWVVHFYNFS